MRPRTLVKPTKIGPRNFVARAAEVRMDELRKVRQQTAHQAFFVGCEEILYYQQIPNGHTCTCHADVTNPNKPNIIVREPGLDSNTHTIVIDLKTPVFGRDNAADTNLDDEVNVNDELFENNYEDNSNPASIADLFAKGTDCGICYRTGYVPAYGTIGRQRQVFTSHTYTDLYGYWIDRDVTPDTFKEQNPTSHYATFKVDIPKYYERMYYRVYDNKTLLRENLYTVDDIIIDDATVRANAGKVFEVRIKADIFTHLVIEFSLGQKIQGNFPQFSVTKDYSQFFALQTVTIELPPTICAPKISDLIYAPVFGRVWEIIDIQPVYDKRILIMTAVQGRLVNSIETKHTIHDLLELK